MGGGAVGHPVGGAWSVGDERRQRTGSMNESFRGRGRTIMAS